MSPYLTEYYPDGSQRRVPMVPECGRIISAPLWSAAAYDWWVAAEGRELGMFWYTLARQA